MVVFYSCVYYVLYVAGDRMNVLSLFDGMSCGRIALERAGIPVENYFAAEIDKYAIQIAQKNYPEITQLGDVRDIGSGNVGATNVLRTGKRKLAFTVLLFDISKGFFPLNVPH